MPDAGSMAIPALKNHIVLVSGQALPTLLGASLPGREPSHIHAVVTPAMQKAAGLLQQALNARGRQCAFTEYALVSDTGQEAMYSVLNSIYEACGGESLGINLTGGTKLMALAAAEWASAYDVPAFYIDTAGEQAILIGREWQHSPLPDVLTVRGLLAANGFLVEQSDSTPVPPPRRSLLARLLDFTCSPRGEKALGRLNYLAQKALEGGLCVRDEGPEDAAWDELLAFFSEAGMAQAEAGYVAFPDEAARSWCNGLWFEEYVKMTLYHLKAKQRIHDFASSVTVRRDGVLNELDALFTARNRLFTIECKTTAMPLNRAASFLYKADSLHDRLGGVFARAMLCSVRPLASKDRERARSMGVCIVCGRDLLSLEEKLSAWSKQA